MGQKQKKKRVKSLCSSKSELRRFEIERDEMLIEDEETCQHLRKIAGGKFESFLDHSNGVKARIILSQKKKAIERIGRSQLT
jgi:hypothetical protein